MYKGPITIVGSGIIGLWQALTLTKKGFDVTLIDSNKDPLKKSTSRLAGTLLSPWTERENSPEIIKELGILGIKEWVLNYPEVYKMGSLILAAPRDEHELLRFSRMTEGHKIIDHLELKQLEPQIAERFNKALFFPNEAHLITPKAMSYLLQAAKSLGASIDLGRRFSNQELNELVIDCRGFAARDHLKHLRGVRGERLLVRSQEIFINRPIRLLHPRHTVYIVPWSEGQYIIGATMLESEDDGPVTVRSALELLGAAYTVHPGFGEAEILEMNSGIRPTFPDNIPRVKVHSNNKLIFVNGAYRHGFLLAPILSNIVADYLAHHTEHPLLIQNDQ